MSQITSVFIVNSTFVQAQIKENIKALRHWSCEENSQVTGELPAQKASNAGNVSIIITKHIPKLMLSWMKMVISQTGTC